MPECLQLLREIDLKILVGTTKDTNCNNQRHLQDKLSSETELNTKPTNVCRMCKYILGNYKYVFKRPTITIFMPDLKKGSCPSQK